MTPNASVKHFSLRLLVCATAVLAFCGTALTQDETTNAASSRVYAGTNGQEFLRASLLLQEQLRATQQAIEQNKKEAEAALARNAENITAQLNLIQQALENQRVRDLDAMRSTNRFMLILACAFAGIGMLAMLLTAYIQWRAVQRIAEIPAALAPAHFWGASRAVAALGTGEGALVPAGPAEQSNARLLGVIERLEKRISELEHVTHTGQPGAANVTAGELNKATDAGGGAEASGSKPRPSEADGRRAEVAALMGKGQSLLNLGQAADALGSLNEALHLDPANVEVLVKKGNALEKLDRLEEALACYDRAIAADGSVTLAYLHKGSLYNRMARYNEALTCYEEALKTQSKARAA